MDSTNGIPQHPDSLYSDIATTEEQSLSSPEELLVDSKPEGEGGPIEGGAPTPQPPTLTDEEREELQRELDEVNSDILALRQTLQSKELQQREIKRKLGITTIGEFTTKARQSWGSVQQSNAYNKTKVGLQSAGQKTGAAFTSFGSAVSRKLGEVRGSSAFKSLEERVSYAATSVKTRVAGTPEDGETFQDALNEEGALADGDNMKTSQSADNIPLNPES